MTDHIQHMRHALALARRNLGQTAPNPAVGCVIVTDGRVVGRGWTARGGRPHAETRALEQAGEKAKGATAYITLEPCAHHGETPPCTDALVGAGIARAMIACPDPDPRTNGAGMALLRGAGIEVVEDVCREEARHLNRGFFKRATQGLPMVTLKLATTLDGKIATAVGESQWITGPQARARAHLLRAEHDAILIGTTTALDDNPTLTCRLPGLEDRSPLRVVLDARLRVPLTHHLVAGASEVPTVFLILLGGDAAHLEALSAAGVDVMTGQAGEGGLIDLRAGLEALGVQGITRVLCEGGGRLAAMLLRDGLVDEIAWFTAPMILGDEGRGAVAGLGIEAITEAVSLLPSETERVGKDMLATFRFPS